MAEKKTTYLLEMKDGSKKKITVPSEWRVTFGALYPGKEANHSKTGLRFYSGNKQHAVFTEVESFRDMSIQIEEENIKKQQETFYKDTPDGKKSFVVEGTVREWVNPDAPGATSSQEFLKGLPLRDDDRIPTTNTETRRK